MEATAIGNVMMQAVGMGQLTSITDARRLLRTSADISEFHPHRPDVWDERLEGFCIRWRHGYSEGRSRGVALSARMTSDSPRGRDGIEDHRLEAYASRGPQEDAYAT